MKIKSKLYLLKFILLSVVTLFASQNVFAQDVIDIPDGASNDEVQALLNTATNGCTINFADGGLYSNVNLILKPQTEGTRLSNITINGNNATLEGAPTMGSYTNGVFTIQGVDGFTLADLTIFNDGVMTATSESPSTIVIADTSNGNIKDNSIQGGRYGILLSNHIGTNSNTTVDHNNIVEVADSGIISYGASNSLIKDNTITDVGSHGIDIRYGTGANATITGNHISNTNANTSDCVYLAHSRGHNVEDNKFSNCSTGVTVYGAANCTLDNNKFISGIKIGFLLEGGYQNITIGEDNNFSGLISYPDPRTYVTHIAKADSSYIASTSGTFSDNSYAQHVWDEGVVTKEPTYEEEGTKLYTCSCGEHTFELTLPKLQKKDNTLDVVGKVLGIKAKAVAKKAKAFPKEKLITFNDKGQGTLSFTKASGNKKITIDETLGTVTINKGIKKGTYSISVKVKASGNEEYKESKNTTIAFIVNVK